MVGGFCIDVFAAAINLLQYPVTYRFIPFGNGLENPSYTQLINKIVTNVSSVSEMSTLWLMFH